MDLKEKVRNEVISARILAKTVDEAVNEIFSLFNVIVPKGTSCLSCGYPKLKKHHEDFERCEGCEWTGKED